jgi:hypothetical protein
LIQVVQVPSWSQLRRLNCDPPYQIQRQSPLDQLTISQVYLFR